MFQPQAASYTFFRKGAAASRLDRMYVPAHLVQDIMHFEHFPYISDHKGVKCILRHSNLVNPPPSQNLKYWKLNSKIMSHPDFAGNFLTVWERLTRDETLYNNTSEWWEEKAKPEIVEFGDGPFY